MIHWLLNHYLVVICGEGNMCHWKSTFTICSVLLLCWWLLTSEAVTGLKTHFSFLLPCQGSDLALVSFLLSLTADRSHFSLCSTPPKTSLFLSHWLSLHLSHHCLYKKFIVTKKQRPQGWLEVIWRRGTDPRGELMQGAVSSHVLYEKHMENRSHCLLWRDPASLLTTYRRNGSQRRIQRNI